jgi:hypothetical protein
MKSTEAGSLLLGWLDSTEPELHLAIDGGEVVLQRADGGVLCKAALSVGWRGAPGLLEKALRLSAPSLGIFHERSAALSMNPADGRFWLLLRAVGDGYASLEERVEESLGSLINQRDSWNEQLKREAPGKRVSAQPLPVRSFRQGGAYA